MSTFDHQHPRQKNYSPFSNRPGSLPSQQNHSAYLKRSSRFKIYTQQRKHFIGLHILKLPKLTTNLAKAIKPNRVNTLLKLIRI